MDSTNIYIVEGSAGQWDSHRIWLVCAATTEKAAQDWRQQAQLHANRAMSIEQYHDMVDQRVTQRDGPEDPEGVSPKRAAIEATICTELDREINPFDPQMQQHRVASDDPRPAYRVVTLPLDPVMP